MGLFDIFLNKEKGKQELQNKAAKLKATITRKISQHEAIKSTNRLALFVSIEDYISNASSAMTDVTGYSQTELMKMKFTDLIFPSDLTKYASIIHGTKRGIKSFTVRLLTKDKEIVSTKVTFSKSENHYYLELTKN